MGANLLLALAAASTALWLVQTQSGDMDGPTRLTPNTVEPGSVVEPNTTASTGDNHDFCSVYPHQLTLHFQGCEGSFETFSCTGRCFTTEEPNFFYSR